MSAGERIEIRRAVEMREGAGVRVKRLMPVPGWSNYDPFVLCDHFLLAPGTGFPRHSHRGFEAVTYVFEGAMRHEDDLGNRSTVLAGGVQRFTAGRGIAHSEMPDSEEPTQGVQLWVNLPRHLKEVEASYQPIDAAMVPVRRGGGSRIAVIVGEPSPVELRTPVRYLDLHLEAGATLTEIIPRGFRGFVYVISGSVAVGGQMVDSAQACFVEDPGEISMEAWEASRCLLCFGQPSGEPIRQRGPYVD